MKGKHTPGPWKMGHTFPDGDISILNENGLTTICTVHNHAADAATDDSAQRRNAETKANLNMIVAGPELLGAAEALLSDWDSPTLSDSTPIAEKFDALRSAVAKARAE